MDNTKPLAPLRGKANPLRTIHFSFAGYLLLLCLTVATESGLVKALANAAAIGIFIVAAVNWAFYKSHTKVQTDQILSLTLLYIGIFGSTAINFRSSEVVDVIKIAIAPSFIIIGTSLAVDISKWSMKERSTKLLFWALILLPLLAILIQLLTGSRDFSENKQIGFFANRNNAGLYAICLLSFYCVLTDKPFASPILYMCVGLMFGTLGLFLAVVLALFLSISRAAHLVMGIVLIASTLILVSFFPEVGSKLRIKPVIDSIVLLASGRIDLETVTYADLVRLLNTQDLSFLFRLKHWYNLFNIYIDGNFSNYLFGFGAGSSVALSTINLVPHNDYIRVIFEFGFIAFLGFIGLLVSVVRSIPRGWTLTPILVVVVYFFSENLINNYLAMILFFLSAGVLATRSRMEIDTNQS
ncbi:O-antigen ligase family protein [Rhodoferax sp.]|uniref:O-antigen ligase family protein n=1 Tax=Rhodoferax sp. TaxID=50421 RepID=UPI002ACD4787|nr:O-antigen ligase family protein [Rhodoferax sp.]MDZ7919080.1 O-antigen ligase family protein [Rhodoferax sp.]